MMSPTPDLGPREAQLVRELLADVGVERIADVYAKALLAATEKAGQSADVLAEFDAVMTDVIGAHPKLEAVFASALIGTEEKLGILDRLFDGKVSKLLIHFLKVVARHGRLDCLRAIHRQVKRQYDTIRGRVRVRLTTATPIDAALAASLTAALTESLHGDAVVTQAVDPRLIGGAVLRIGDTVYDGSIANQLKNIRQQMMDRSAHEIQSRRDRFRNPARD